MESERLSKPRNFDLPGTKVSGENFSREYKSICKGPQNETFLQKIQRFFKDHANQVLSFLNTQGGVIHFGVHEDTKLAVCTIEEGLCVTPQERIQIEREIEANFFSKFEYLVESNYFTIKWIPMPEEKFRLNLHLKKFPESIGYATKIRSGSNTLSVPKLPPLPKGSPETINVMILAHYARKIRILDSKVAISEGYADELARLTSELFSMYTDLPQWFVTEIITKVYYFCGRMKSSNFPVGAIWFIKNIIVSILDEYCENLTKEDLNLLGHIIFCFVNSSVFRKSKKFLSTGGFLYLFSIRQLSKKDTYKIKSLFQQAKEVIEREDKKKLEYLLFIEEMTDVERFSKEEDQLEKKILDTGYKYY